MHIRSLVYCFLLAPIVASYVINENIKDVSNKITDRDLFDIEGFLDGYGYPFENHEVTTEDGYILGVHRIPHGKNSSAIAEDGKPKPAVLIMHGLLANSVDFVILGPNQSIGMLFADMGYDVWLGNNRGNTWSRKHVSLNPDVDRSFWDFSFHEFGVYDDTAMIDYILNVTSNEKIYYIGHSQGTTQFFALASSRPEYNDKVALMTALAPIVFMEHVPNPIIQIVKKYSETLDMLADYFNLTEILPHLSEYTTLLEAFCSEDSVYQEVCFLSLSLLCGFDGDAIDRSSFHLIFKTLPAGASIRQVKHYLQEINSGHFRQFDYGEEKNLKVYGNISPPDYDLTAVKAPIALQYSENDWFVGLSDLDRLVNLLPNIAAKHLVANRKFNHFDFLFGKDAISLCYIDVANAMSKYSGIEPLT